MELVSCPQCGAFSPSTAKECQGCHAPLPDEVEAAAAATAVPAIGFAKEPEALDAPPQERPPAAEELAPFEAAPPVLARMQELEAAIQQKPTATALYLKLAHVYEEGERKDLAARVVERSLALDPTNVYLKHRLAQITGAAATSPPVAVPSSPRAATSDPSARRPTTAVTSAVFRPRAAPTKNLMRRSSRKLKLAVAGGLTAVALTAGLKMWLFPSTRRLVGGDFRASSPVWSPTGRHLAFLMADGASTQIGVYDFDKGASRTIGPAYAWDSRAFSWSPDGTKLAYAGPGGDQGWDQSVFVVDVAGGQPRKLAAGASPAWSPDSQTLIMVCAPERPSFMEEGPAYEGSASLSAPDLGERYCRVDVASGHAQRTALGLEHGSALSPLEDAVVFEQSPEGTSGEAAGAAVASAQKDFDQLVDNVAAGRARNVAEGSRDLSRELEARRYAKKRAAAMTTERLPYAADVFVADLTSGAIRALTSDRQSAFPSWTADGERILFATNGPAGLEFCTMKPDGSDRKTVLSGIKGIDPYTVTLSPDGRNVFFVAAVPADEGMAKIMTGESPADLHVAAVGSNQAKRLSNRHPFKQRYAVSPDGKRIVYEVLQDVKALAGAGKSELWLMRW